MQRSVSIGCQFLTLLVSLPAFSAGCGGAPAKNENLAATAPVTGVVTYQGKPVKDAVVTFNPTGEGNPAVGTTEENGRFILTTYKERDGAAIGTHIVTIKVMPDGGLPGQEVASTGGADIPAKYGETGTSPLTVDVKEGSNNLELKIED